MEMGMPTEKMKKKKFDWRAYGFVWSILIIPVILFIYANGYLNLESFRLAFQNIKGEWTLENFIWAYKDFSSDTGVMREALRNTLLFFFNSLIVVNFFTMFLSYFLFN